VVAEDDIALGIPVRLAQALDRRQAEVIRDDASDLAVPGALGVRLAELLIKSAEKRDPDQGTSELV